MKTLADYERIDRIFMTGLPLSGKSTFIKMVCVRTDLQYVSTGDIYRQKMGSGNIDPSIARNDVSSFANDAINSKIFDSIVEGKKLFDGWPRSVEQIEMYKHWKSIYERTEGEQWVIVYCYLNPVEIYARAQDRKRDRADAIEIVKGRVEAGLKFKDVLVKHVPIISLDMSKESELIGNLKLITDKLWAAKYAKDNLQGA